jgi:Xaa-Pro aminopeptidase
MPAPRPETERLRLLRRLMKEGAVEALLLTSPANRRYFSGFLAHDPMIDESSGALLITPRSLCLLTDSRYAEAARREAPLFETIVYRGGLAAELPGLPALKKVGRLHFEPEFLSQANFSRIAAALPQTQLEPVPFDPAGPRAGKLPGEIRLMTKALAITEAAVGALWDRMEAGLTEHEAAFFIETEFRRLGAEGPAFETIVAAGPNGAMPHAIPGAKKIKKGETVIIDCGAKYQGYCADLTRTLILGPPQKWQREIYAIVREAQILALAALAPGRSAREVDKVARDFIAQRGYGDFFGHSLGHGVGLVIHEAPSLSPRSAWVLEPGQIVTVEPGIYLPGRGGVRLEQMALITEKGARVLNRDAHFYDFQAAG